MTPLRTGGRILVDQLAAHGCSRIFTVPGESFLAVLDALHDTPAIDVVTCRQEGGAAFMACADAALTQDPGICFVTRGPGATNAAIGVHVAMQDSQPMILFIGDVDRSMRDREAFQEIDFAAMFAPIAKWAARIDDARRIPEYVARAYNVALSGRMGPVVLALPEDMLVDEVEAADRHTPPSPSPSGMSLDALFRLRDMLGAAERPVVILGGSEPISGNDHDGLYELFARLGVPIATGFRRQSMLHGEDCPVYAGNLGYGPNPRLVQRIRDADLIIAIGTRLSEATTDGYTLITPDHPGQALVHIHPDPAELGRVYRTDLAIRGGIDDFAAAGPTTLKVPRFTSGAEAHAEWLDWSTPRPREGAVLDLGQCVMAMREVLPRDTIICNGAGNYSGWWHRYWRYDGSGTQLAPTAGAMGYGVPAAIAAALREPERMVVAVAGDGDFLMNGQELATAMQHGANLLVIVVDNGTYGTIRMHQAREYPGRSVATRLVNPDFVMLARAFGCWAEHVDRTDAFAPALARAMQRTGVRLLHLTTEIEQISHGATLSAIEARR